MSYLHKTTVGALAAHHDAGVRSLVRVYRDLMAESERVCALGERWLEGTPEARPYGLLAARAANAAMHPCYTCHGSIGGQPDTTAELHKPAEPQGLQLRLPIPPPVRARPTPGAALAVVHRHY